MNGHIFAETEIASRFLFKLARRIRHVEATAAVADWKAVSKDVLAKLDSRLGIERLHEAVAKNISGNDVRMPGAKDQVAIGVDPGPVKRHEATLVSKRVEIGGEPATEILAT